MRRWTGSKKCFGSRKSEKRENASLLTRIAPKSACSASILCGGARNAGSAAWGACLRAAESNGAMVPIKRFACGRFAVGRFGFGKSSVTQHRGSLNDSGTLPQTPRATTHALSLIERRRLGKPCLRLSPLLTAPKSTVDSSRAALDGSLAAAALAGLCAGKPQRHSVAGFARAQSRFFARDIVARRRRDAFVLGQLDLKYDHVAAAECHLGAGEVELPHPHEALIVKPHHLVAVGKETLAPGFERLGIVQLQNFDVADQKAGALDGRQHFGQRRDVAAREDVFGDPGIGDAGRAAAADRVQQRDAIVGEKLRPFAEEDIVKADADMLEHADRYDAVEAAIGIAIVDQVESGIPRKPALDRPVLGALVLLLRQRDTGHLRAGNFRKIERQTAPAAADIEHLGPGLDAELRREMALLGQLRVVERLILRLEIGAAILLVAVEEQPVKPAVEVVVMRNVVARTRSRIELLQPPEQIAQQPRQQ